jgi:hypothetical protein
MRNVVEDECFRQEAEVIQPDVRFLDDALRGFIWAVSTHPESAGNQSRSYPGVYVRRLRLPTPQGTVHRVSIFYTFDDERVFLLSIKRWPQSRERLIL